MEPVINNIRESVDYFIRDASEESERSLLCYAALDTGLGHILRDKELPTQWFMTEVRQAIENQLPIEGSRALLDTTTITNALCILDPNAPLERIYGNAVFDLSTFLSAVVFEDNLVYLKVPGVSTKRINELIEDIGVVELPWGGEDTLSLVIENAWSYAENYSSDLYDNPQFSKQFVDHWSTLTGTTLDSDISSWPKSYRKYFSSVDSQAISHAVLKADIKKARIDNLFGPTIHEKFIVESSIRAMFYSILGSVLESNYYASAHRSNLKRVAFDAVSAFAQQDNLALYELIDVTYQKDIASDLAVNDNQQLPFILSAALAGVETGEQFVQKINELRRIAKPIRQRKAELVMAVRNRDQASLHAISKALSEDSILLSQHQYFLNHGILSRVLFSSGGARPVFGALGKLLLSFSSLPDDVKDLLRKRCVRPEIWAMTRLSAQSRRAIHCLPNLYDVIREKGIRVSQNEKDEHLQFLGRLAESD